MCSLPEAAGGVEQPATSQHGAIEAVLLCDVCSLALLLLVVIVVDSIVVIIIVVFTIQVVLLFSYIVPNLSG